MPALMRMPSWMSTGWMPTLLGLAALLAGLLAGQGLLPGWLLALALLLATTAALLAGALWSRQRQLDHLHEARQQAQLLGQLVDVWCWQTDAGHRLVKLQPPQGAPSSAWVAGAFSGDCLWQRFDDAAHSLQPRMQAQAPLGELRVLQAPAVAGAPPRRWRLRGLPRLDGRGRFAGYTGVAWPSDADDQAAAARQALDALLTQGPAALCLAVPDADGQGWQLQRASPAARQLLGLPASAADGPDAPALPWDQALAALPDGLRQQVLGLQPGGTAEADGWQACLQVISPADAAANTPCQGQLLLALAPTAAVADTATQALAAEHAAFSYTISHDLRAPIRVVEGFGRILKEDYGTALDRVGRDHIDRVMAAAARMNHMIDALLSLSRLSSQPLVRQPVDLSQLAGFVVDELRRSAPERQVAVHIAPGMVAQGDPTLLRMALENLLGNAWKYSAKVAQAVVRFEPEVQSGRPGFVVSDNGAGFDMRFADRLFGVFQRLHSSSDFQGTGIGLASVRRIVRRHGGEIWAESAVGQGARFHFRLKD
ncbi:sensor histidine kinase [Pseudaquabacterium pictum]|nr:ATP-binding protein [Rubrivivax pictus]